MAGHNGTRQKEVGGGNGLREVMLRIDIEKGSWRTGGDHGD